MTKSETSVSESFHKNGQLKIRRNYKDVKPYGLWEKFHENGQLWVRENYKDGKKEGLWKSFHENGQLKRTIDASELGIEFPF